MDVVKPGDKLSKILGINDFIAAPLLLLFYPMMDEEILEIIQKKENFGVTHVAFISKEDFHLPGSNNVWFIKDDEHETIFQAFEVVGNNCKAAVWVGEDGEIMTKVQQLTDMKFLIENLIPGYSDKNLEMDETQNESLKKEESIFHLKTKTIPIVGVLLSCLLILLAVFIIGYEYCQVDL